MYSWDLILQSHLLSREHHPFQISVTNSKRPGWEERGEGRVVNTGASTQVMDGNTVLKETKVRCIITAKDKEKPMAFLKNFSASTIQVLQRDVRQVN